MRVTTELSNSHNKPCLPGPTRCRQADIGHRAHRPADQPPTPVRHRTERPFTPGLPAAPPGASPRQASTRERFDYHPGLHRRPRPPPRGPPEHPHHLHHHRLETPTQKARCARGRRMPCPDSVGNRRDRVTTNPNPFTFTPSRSLDWRIAPRHPPNLHPNTPPFRAARTPKPDPARPETALINTSGRNPAITPYLPKSPAASGRLDNSTVSTRNQDAGTPAMQNTSNTRRALVSAGNSAVSNGRLSGRYDVRVPAFRGIARRQRD